MKDFGRSGAAVAGSPALGRPIEEKKDPGEAEAGGQVAEAGGFDRERAGRTGGGRLHGIGSAAEEAGSCRARRTSRKRSYCLRERRKAPSPGR